MEASNNQPSTTSFSSGKYTVGLHYGTEMAPLQQQQQQNEEEPTAFGRFLEYQQLQQEHRRQEQQDEEYEQVHEGRIQKASCHAFTIQNPYPEMENMLEWYGITNDKSFFHVAQQSFMFYEYHNSNDDASSSSSSSYPQYMADLGTWMEGMAAISTNHVTPNCTRIETPQTIFHSSNALEAYWSINNASNYWNEQDYNGDQNYYNYNNNNYYNSQAQYGVWDSPGELYQGAICGMGSDRQKIQVGVFLDSQCTVLVPKLMYEYRMYLMKTNNKNDDDDAYSDGRMESEYIATLAAESRKTLSCKKYDICGTMLGHSVDTGYCSNQYDRHERQLKGNDDQRRRNATVAAWSEFTKAYYFSKVQSYQLSSYDLYDMTTMCSAAVKSLANDETLESYLRRHGQLQVSPPIMTLSQRMVLMFVVLLGISAIAFCFYRAIKMHQRDLIMASIPPKGSSVNSKNSDDSDSIWSVEEDDYKSYPQSKPSDANDGTIKSNNLTRITLAKLRKAWKKSLQKVKKPNHSTRKNKVMNAQEKKLEDTKQVRLVATDRLDSKEVPLVERLEIIPAEEV